MSDKEPRVYSRFSQAIDPSQTLNLGLDADKEIKRYDLDSSTFDLIDVDQFHKLGFGVLMDYIIFTWIFFILHWVLFGVDIYTCLNILVFHKWGKEDYTPYAYSVAKWIFTGCIIFEVVLRLYQWIWAIRTYRTKNIALCYVNFWTRLMFSLKRYNYHCLFYSIKPETFFDWAAMHSYFELDNLLNLCVADAPRQVINILTLRFYATSGDFGSNIQQIGSNIAKIATTNLKLAIILSFMCASIVIWAIFFFKFLLGMILYIPVIFGIRRRGFKSLKKYCCVLVNSEVRTLIRKHHKSKRTLLEEGIMNLDEIRANPLLHSSGTTNTFPQKSLTSKSFEYRGVDTHLPNDSNIILNKPSRVHAYESLPMRDIGQDQNYNPKNPFDDIYQAKNNSGSFSHSNTNVYTNRANLRKPPPTKQQNLVPSSLGDQQYNMRSGSASSLVYEEDLSTTQYKPYEPYVSQVSNDIRNPFEFSRSQTLDEITTITTANKPQFPLNKSQTMNETMIKSDIFGKGLPDRYITSKDHLISDDFSTSDDNQSKVQYIRNWEDHPHDNFRKEDEYRVFYNERPSEDDGEESLDFRGAVGNPTNIDKANDDDNGLLGDYYQVTTPYPVRESAIIKRYAASEIYPEENDINRQYTNDEDDDLSYRKGYR